jgi:hypothetical protein
VLCHRACHAFCEKKQKARQALVAKSNSITGAFLKKEKSPSAPAQHQHAAGTQAKMPGRNKLRLSFCLLFPTQNKL